MLASADSSASGLRVRLRRARRLAADELPMQVFKSVVVRAIIGDPGRHQPGHHRSPDKARCPAHREQDRRAR